MNPDGYPMPRIRRLPTAATPPPPSERDELRLLRVAASCPRCSSRPALRVTPAVVGALASTPAATRVATYQCQRRGCGAVYDVTAEAFQKAS